MPFRFLDLPSELRLSVYENIPVTNQQWIFRDANRLPLFDLGIPVADSTIILVVQQVSRAILATCRLVHEEARVIIANRRQHEVGIETPRMIVDLTFLNALVKMNGLVARILAYRDEFQERLDLEEELSPEELKTPFDLLDTEGARLDTFIVSCGRRLVADPSTYFEISLFGNNDWSTTALTAFRGMCRFVGAYNVKLAVAGPRYCRSIEDHGRREDWFAYEMAHIEQTNALLAKSGRAHQVNLIRGDEFDDYAEGEWDDTWGVNPWSVASGLTGMKCESDQ